MGCIQPNNCTSGMTSTCAIELPTRLVIPTSAPQGWEKIQNQFWVEWGGQAKSHFTKHIIQHAEFRRPTNFCTQPCSFVSATSAVQLSSLQGVYSIFKSSRTGGSHLFSPSPEKCQVPLAVGQIPSLVFGIASRSCK